MVGDTLVVTDDVKKLGYLLGILSVGVIGRNLDEVRAEGVLEVIDLTLDVTDGVRKLLVEAVKEGYSILKRLGSKLSHGVRNLSSSCNRNAGSGEKTVVKKSRGLVVVLRVLDDKGGELSKLLIEGSDKCNANELEESVHECNAPSVDSHRNKSELHYRVKRIEDDGYKHNADNVEGKVYYRRTLTVLVCTE